ncbi:ketopantoate reductase PanE/ApbA C terminal-domain-containing protein [Lactifluus volemus]|nr:ketopantoate reductase PanE/ApbA C terminal-domain-containing protein [Lactifluus volemus]
MLFHVLGLGPIGTLVSHHLCKTLDTTKHGIVLIHKNLQQLKRANKARNVLKVERNGIVDTSTAFRSEVFESVKQFQYEKRHAKRHENIPQEPSPIESLIVAIKAYTVVDALKVLAPRLTANSTIVLLHNGMGVYERLVDTIFRNPELRPRFIVASIDHGAWNTDFFHTIHAGVGSISFGIVGDPGGEDVPVQERVLSLDRIMSPQEGHDSPYRTLRDTVAALSNLSGLNAVWKPISHVEIAMKRKLVVNSVINPLTALLGCRNGDLLESLESMKIIRRICHEAAEAFAMQHNRRKGFRTTEKSEPGSNQDSALEEECLRVIRLTAGNISSMLTDVRAGSYTEIDYMNGYLMGLGRSFELPMATTSTLHNLIRLRSALPLDRVVYT